MRGNLRGCGAELRLHLRRGGSVVDRNHRRAVSGGEGGRRDAGAESCGGQHRGTCGSVRPRDHDHRHADEDGAERRFLSTAAEVRIWGAAKGAGMIGPQPRRAGCEARSAARDHAGLPVHRRCGGRCGAERCAGRCGRAELQLASPSMAILRPTTLCCWWRVAPAA